MNEFLLRCEKSPELKKEVHIKEFALQKNYPIRVNSFDHTCRECVRYCFDPYEKYEWIIRSQNITAHPTDFVIIQPRQKPDAEKTYLESASHYWLNLYSNIQRSGSKNYPGNRSDISPQKFISTRRKLFLSIWPDAGIIR